MNSSGVREMTAQEHRNLEELRAAARAASEEEPSIVRVARAIHDSHIGLMHLYNARERLDAEIAELRQRMEVLHKEMQAALNTNRGEQPAQAVRAPY